MIYALIYINFIIYKFADAYTGKMSIIFLISMKHKDFISTLLIKMTSKNLIRINMNFIQVVDKINLSE